MAKLRRKLKTTAPVEEYPEEANGASGSSSATQSNTANVG